MPDRPNAVDALRAHQLHCRGTGTRPHWCKTCKAWFPDEAAHQVAEMWMLGSGQQPVVILGDGTLDKLTADEWALIEFARAHPDAIACRLPDGTLSVAEPECVAEGHATAVFDTDGSVEVWHDPDDGPCEWVYRIEGAS